MSYIVPYIGKGSMFGYEELDAIKKLLLNDETLSCSKVRASFEEKFAEFIGVKYAFALTNCTVALEFASYLAGIQGGDEIITTCFSYQATILPLLTKKVKIKFCDIEPNNLGLDLYHLKKLITPNTKAVFITHYGGIVAKNIYEIVETAHNYGAVVIEDCAHTIGSTYKAQKAGSFGDIGCFSFHSLKNISTLGQGGMITLNNEKWAKIVKKIRGTEPDAKFYACENIFGDYKSPNDNIERHSKNSYTENCDAVFYTGTNATLCEPACAAGIEQMKKLHLFNNRRIKIAKMLNDGLRQIPGTKVQQVDSNYFHTYHLYTFFLTDDAGIDRDTFVNLLDKKGIQIVLRYFPMHLLPEWRMQGGGYGLCPVAEKLWFESLVNLPCYPKLNDEQIYYMIKTIAEIIN
ncbi:MAG: DegT/DnrJ/EryC1/StrS family aminotransferase [Endomicrobium sp.]|nr:DegT/DnrJ/EryC1/StrS family aminotransferase [Endomicrobium sp.]